MQLQPKNKKTLYLTVALTPEMKKQIKAAAKKHHLTMSEFMRQLAENFLLNDFNSIEIIQQNRQNPSASRLNVEQAKELALP